MVINIQVKQKKGFARTGQDVVYYMTISFPQAVLGAVINVPTAYGTVNCEIPAGIKPGEQLCLAGYFSKIAEFLSTSEDAMWDMMEYPEFCIMMNAQTEKNTAISAKIATNPLVRLL